MNQERNNQPGAHERGLNRTEKNSTAPNDLPDSDQDNEKLKAEETFIDLPEVKDIPGQEFVHPAPLGALGDTTISSDDEEGKSIFGVEDSEEDEEAGYSNNNDTRVQEERSASTRDEHQFRKASLDNEDYDRNPLHEKSFGDVRSLRDLDIPGSELEERDEETNQSDEDNDFNLSNNREN